MNDKINKEDWAAIIGDLGKPQGISSQPTKVQRPYEPTEIQKEITEPFLPSLERLVGKFPEAEQELVRQFIFTHQGEKFPKSKGVILNKLIKLIEKNLDSDGVIKYNTKTSKEILLELFGLFVALYPSFLTDNAES